MRACVAVLRIRCLVLCLAFRALTPNSKTQALIPKSCATMLQNSCSRLRPVDDSWSLLASSMPALIRLVCLRWTFLIKSMLRHMCMATALENGCVLGRPLCWDRVVVQTFSFSHMLIGSMCLDNVVPATAACKDLLCDVLLQFQDMAWRPCFQSVCRAPFADWLDGPRSTKGGV